MLLQLLEKIKQNIPSDFNSGFISNLSPTTAHTTLIQILEEDYLYERLYEGLKMEGASNFTEFEFSKRGFGENSRFTELMKRSLSLKGSEGLLKGSRHDLIG